MRLRCFAPQFLACAFHRLRDQGLGDRRQMLGHRLGFVDVAMRWLAAVYAAELSGLGLAPPRDYKILVTRKLVAPSFGDWSRAVKALGGALGEVDPDRLVAPELAAPFRQGRKDPLHLAEILKGFVETRNDRVGHRKGIQVPPEADAAAILKEQGEAFRRLCRVLGAASVRPLLVISKTWEKAGQHHVRVVRFTGRDPLRLRDVRSAGPLPVDQQVPFLVGDHGQALALYPWIVVQQGAATGLHMVKLWYCWDEQAPGLLYTDPTGVNESTPYTCADEDVGPDAIPDLVGRPGQKAQPKLLLSLPQERVRREQRMQPDQQQQMQDLLPRAAKSLPELDQYTFESTQLGRGASGTVYRGRHRGPGGADHPVAIKVMHDQILDDHEFRARFEREGLILKKLRHAGIISVLDHGLEPTPHIVMALVEGGDLASLRSVQTFSIATIATIGVRVLRALAHAHKRGIVH